VGQVPLQATERGPPRNHCNVIARAATVLPGRLAAEPPAAAETWGCDRRRGSQRPAAGAPRRTAEAGRGSGWRA
jgi:hypothetical protein